jgi:hypothetical protein
VNDTELQVVGTFTSRIEADIAQGALRTAGITAMLSADDAGGERPDLARRGIRILVRQEDASEAEAILKSRS